MKNPAYLALGLLILGSVQAATTTVSTVASLTSTVASAAAGDTIYLADGTYNNSGTFTLSPGGGGGSALSPITVAALNPGKAVFTGTTTMNVGTSATTSPVSYLIISGFRFDSAINASSTLQDVVAFNNAQNCRLTECAFINCGNLSTTGAGAGTTLGTAAHIIGVYDGSSYLRLDHNFFKGGFSQSISFVVNGKAEGFSNSESGPWHWIDHNTFTDIEPMAGNGQEPVQVGQSTLPKEMHVMVEWNLWDDASGDTEFFSFKTADNTARFNTFRDGLINYGTLSLRCGNNNTVDGNFVYSLAEGIVIEGSNQTVTNNYIQDFTNGFFGMSFGAINLGQGTSEATDTQAQPARRALIANNTVVNFNDNAQPPSSYPTQAPAAGIEFGAANYSTATLQEGTAQVHASQNVILNNILQGSQGTIVLNLDSDSTTFAGNYTYNSGSAAAGMTGTGITALSASPLTLDSSGPIPLYRLQSSAAIIGQASVIAGLVPPEDMDGQARSVADPGSDEYSSTSLIRRAILPTDVGPLWMGRSTSSLIPDSSVTWGPSTLTAVATNPTTVSLTWSGASTTSGFQYRYHDAASPWSIPTTTLASGTSTTAAVTVLPNTQYSFQVRSLGANSDGSDASAWSPEAVAVAPLGYAGAPSGTSEGTVTVEAEDYTDLSPPSDGSTTYTAWIFGSTTTGSTGLGYMQASVQATQSDWTNATGMDYDLYLPDSGTYTAWARVYAANTSSDTLRWGTNGTESTTSPVYVTPYNTWTWVSLGTFSAASAGTTQVLNIKRREANLLLDRLYITKNGDTPSGNGPAEDDFLERPMVTSSTADATSPVTVNSGTASTLVVAATGNPAPTYQWQTVSYGTSTSSPNATSTAISGATSASYTLSSPTSANYGFYSAAVTNPAGTVTSPAFNLGVITAPTFVSQPSGAAISYGSVLTLTATANLMGWSGSVTWLRNGVSVGGGSAAYPAEPGSGSTTLTYSVPYATTANAGTYTVQLYNTAGTVTSSPVTVTVTDTTAPWQVSGSTLAIEAEAYTSTYAGDSGSYGPWTTATTISGSNGAGYIQASSQSAVPSWIDAPGVQYALNFTSAGTYTVWIRAYATDNASDSVYWGTNGTEAASNPVYTSTYNSWVWYSMGTWTIASGDLATTQILEIRRREHNDSIDRIYITKNGDTPSGNGPAVTARAVPGFTTQPSSITATIGQTPSTVTLTAAAANATRYQWYRNGAAISGANSASYSLAVSVSDLPPYGRIAGSGNYGVQGTYTVAAYNSEGFVMSQPAFLLVKRLEDQANRGNTYPYSASVATGKPILLTVTPDAWADGSSATVIYPQIQWLKNGTVITGATGASYLIPGAASGDAATYSVQLTYSYTTPAVSESETLSVVTLTVL